MAINTKSKIEKAKSINTALVNATTAAISITVENGEKWQKLTKKLVKKSEPIRRKQMDMVFDTATAVKDHVNTGKEKMLELVDYDPEVANRILGYATDNPVSKKVMEVTDSIKEMVAENPVVKQMDKATENIRTMGAAKLDTIKEDVLEQAQNILNKGEEIVEDALGSKKAEKEIKTKVATEKKSVKAKAATASKKATPKAKAAKATKKVTAEKPVEVDKKAVDSVKA